MKRVTRRVTAKRPNPTPKPKPSTFTRVIRTGRCCSGKRR